jgi:hypothetical protein
VHFLFRETAEIISDILVCNFGGLFKGHSLDYLGQGGRAGDCAGTAEGFEFGVFYSAFIVEFESQFQRITARKLTDLADAVGIRYFAYVSRIEKVFSNFIRIFPHNFLPLTCLKRLFKVSHYIIDMSSANRDAYIIGRYTG